MRLPNITQTRSQDPSKRPPRSPQRYPRTHRQDPCEDPRQDPSKVSQHHPKTFRNIPKTFLKTGTEGLIEELKNIPSQAQGPGADILK